MATQFNFNGRLVKLPGSYSEIRSGINNPPLELSFGNVLIIDDRVNDSYGGGSGINGQLEQGEGSIYGFDNIRDLQEFVGGGLLWDLAVPLFRPFGPASQGASTVSIVRALTTTAATYTLNLGGGSVVFQSKYEGLVGNGIEGEPDHLTQGFAVTMENGVVDPTKFRFKFWRGSYKGIDSEGNVFDSISPINSTPIVIATSDEVDSITELLEWASVDFDFNNTFAISSSTIGSDTIVAADLTATSGNQLFVGGTQSSSIADFDAVHSAVTKLDYTFVLSLDSASNALSANNFRTQFHLLNEARFQKYLVVAGGNDKDTFINQSITTAQSFDSNRVIVTHGAVKISTPGGGQRIKNSLYKAAMVLGRTCGLDPQTPITFKGLNIDGEVHRMSDRERIQALDAGVLTTYFDTDIQGGTFVITQGINSLQNNRFVVNEDGTSHQISLERISAQLNKEIEVNSKNTLLGNQNQGPNRATLSPEVVAEWTENYLRTKEATATVDNLILSFQDVTVTTVQDAYKISYAFVPNFEVNKLFFTGLILDPNIQ